MKAEVNKRSKPFFVDELKLRRISELKDDLSVVIPF